MRRSMAAFCLCVCLVAPATLAGADFWVAKPFLTWSDKDVQKMDADSPWAGIVSVPLPPSMPMPAGDASGGRGGGEDRGFGPPVRRISVTISWRSALPVKQAQVRSQVGQGGTVSAEQQTFLAQEEQLYVVALRGLPPQYVRSGPGSTIQARLRRAGKPDIVAEQAAAQRTATGPVLLVGFPRADGVSLDDGTVEFVVKFDELEVSKKFKLKDMMFGGKLEL